MTRTFVVGGEPDEEIRGYHRLAKEALDRCAEAIKPGLSGKDLHTMVCEFFHEHGHPTQLHKEEGQVLDSGFYHATRSWRRARGAREAEHRPHRRAVRRPATCWRSSPGLYRAGYGGVRLEDLILVTEDGAEVLTDFPYDLEP